MKSDSFLIVDPQSRRRKSGVAMQLSFDAGKYLFLTGRDHGISDMISNLRPVTVYGKEADGLIGLYQKLSLEIAQNITKNVRHSNYDVPLEYTREELKKVFHGDDLDGFSAELNMIVRNCDMLGLSRLMKSKMKNYAEGTLTFPQRLERTTRNKEIFTYSLMDVPEEYEYSTPQNRTRPESCLKGVGRYDMKGRDEVLLSELPDGASDTLYRPPELVREFAYSAAGKSITYS
jgi:hypothetical protein